MFDLLIIGAGPAGISAAWEAQKIGLNYAVIEKGLIGTAKEIAKCERKIRNLINFRDDDGHRLTFVQGGNSDKTKTVFCIVPGGAEPPKP